MCIDIGGIPSNIDDGREIRFHEQREIPTRAKEIKGVGISTAGMVDPIKGIVLNPQKIILAQKDCLLPRIDKALQ